MSDFAATLKVLLSEQSMSQAELARRLGLSSQSVSAWLSSGTTPSRENVERIEDELAVEPRGTLVRLAGYAPDGDPAPTVESLLRADPGITAEDKRLILRIIRMARANAETS